jgi:putative phage-type endonuclease
MSLIFYYSKDLPVGTELKQKYLKDQVKLLKNIFQPEQKSKEWYEMRNNMLTASDWGTVLGENHYSNSNEVLKKKCGDDTFITNAAMQWGNKYEDVAVLIYEHRNNVSILEFGCLQHPFIPFLGASPDGITSDGVMLEIKCPTSRKITGIPPSYYWCQVQGQLEVCELDRCDFLECAIKEYSDENEYLNDHYEGNYKVNKYNNEKGVVAEFYRKSTKTFFYNYSPISLMGKELQEWKNEMVNKNYPDSIFSTFSYWYLEEVSCVPIYRNQEWFNKAKLELELFWNKVLKYRELGYERLLYDLNKIKEEKIKSPKSNLKVKKVSTPRHSQKKIKEYIVLDNNNESDGVLSNTPIKELSNIQEEEYYDEYEIFDPTNTTSMFSDD